ncbi:hypothetical protein ACHAXM_001549 [Skeletonema potamos]
MRLRSFHWLQLSLKPQKSLSKPFQLPLLSWLFLLM